MCFTLRPDSLLRLWRYTNHLLTYLLTENLAYLMHNYIIKQWHIVL